MTEQKLSKDESVAILKVLSTTFSDYRYLYPLSCAVILISGSIAFIVKMGNVQFAHYVFFIIILLIILLFAPRIIPSSDKPSNDNSADINPSEGSQQSSKIMLIGRDQSEIWEGFHGVYNAFNAPWKLETLGDIEKYVKIHINRYEDKLLTRCRYLYFYESDEKNWTLFLLRLELFVKFESMVFLGLSEEDIHSYRFVEILSEKLQAKPKNNKLNKLELHLIRGDIPQLTFFHGTKGNTSTSILYFNVGPFISNGHPKKVLYSFDSEFSARLGEYFHEELDKPDTHKYSGLEIFIFYVGLKQDPLTSRKILLGDL